MRDNNDSQIAIPGLKKLRIPIAADHWLVRASIRTILSKFDKKVVREKQPPESKQSTF